MNDQRRRGFAGSGGRAAPLGLAAILLAAVWAAPPPAFAGALGPALLLLSPHRGAGADTTWYRHATPWVRPEEVLLAAPVRQYGLLGLVRWKTGNGRAVLAAQREVQRRLGLDGVDLTGAEVRLRVDYGRRLSLLTTTGLGSSAEDGLEADYRLWRSWRLRSETRERGETFMELRREILFW